MLLLALRSDYVYNCALHLFVVHERAALLVPVVVDSAAQDELVIQLLGISSVTVVLLNECRDRRIIVALASSQPGSVLRHYVAFGLIIVQAGSFKITTLRVSNFSCGRELPVLLTVLCG